MGKRNEEERNKLSGSTVVGSEIVGCVMNDPYGTRVVEVETVKLHQPHVGSPCGQPPMRRSIPKIKQIRQPATVLVAQPYTHFPQTVSPVASSSHERKALVAASKPSS